MKFLKVLLIILVVLAVLIGILTAIAPTHYDISRSTIVKAPNDIVWGNVSTFANMNKWGPWQEKDTTMKTTIEGTDGTIGAISRWEGNEEVGSGSQEIIALEPNKRMDTKLRFMEPYESEANGYVEMKDTTDGTWVTWGFSTTMSRPMNIMGLFMNMDEMVGPDFEKGLSNLKTLCETEASATKLYRGYQINSSDLPARTFVGKRAIVPWANMPAFYAENFGKIYNDVTAAKLELAGAPCGLYYKWDTVAMQADMAAAVPVKELRSPPKGWEVFTIEASQGLTLDYYGGYTDEMGNAHWAISDYMKERGMVNEPKIVVEEYITDPGSEPDTSKWLTKIYYYL